MLLPSSSSAWGSKGHESVVHLALQMMKPKERKAAFDLIGSDDPCFIGNWADHQREAHPETRNWHYVNIPATVKSYKASRDCQGTCIISQLEWARATVGDHHKSKVERREALLWWFHLTGDLYQPFHCFGKKEGGNDSHSTSKATGRTCTLCGTTRSSSHNISQSPVSIPRHSIHSNRRNHFQP